VVEVDHAADVNQVATARTVEVRAGVRDLTMTRTQMQQGLYTLIPEPPANPGVLQRIPVTVRSDRELSVGNQIWVQQECWEIVDRHAPLDDAPQRSAFLCTTSPPPRACILAGPHESWLYEPDLLDLARAVLGVHADETPATRTIRAAIRAALHGDADVEANLEGDALRILAQAIRGLEISVGLSPALRELGGNLNQHFDDLKPVPLAQVTAARKPESGRPSSSTNRQDDGARRGSRAST
jgi:hypothetical protein